MAKCANCSNEAFFAYLVTSSFKILYCSKHIPKFLGKLSTRLVKISSIEEPVISKPKKAKTSVIIEEPEVAAVSEDVVEEDVFILEDSEGELEVEEGK
jgi:hypothetical protein